MLRNDMTKSRSKAQDKHIKDNFAAQHFQKAFQIALDPNDVLIPEKHVLPSNFEIKYANICSGIFGPKVLTNWKQVFRCPAL